jgi:hypothetical protein
MKSDVFLSAEWRHLAMLNYEIDSAVLNPLVPGGTELDHWQGRSLVSIVGFLFLNTRICDIPIPFHRNFEELNLRFYVRRQEARDLRRGVVFVKEIVPRFAIAMVARILYNENYIARPMRQVEQAVFEGDAASLYGTGFAQALRGKPVSAFIAEGSPVIVRRGRKI